MIDLKIDDKVAIVTGASRGLGEASAVALAEQGAKVLAVARSIDDLNKLKQRFVFSISSNTPNYFERGPASLEQKEEPKNTEPAPK